MEEREGRGGEEREWSGVEGREEGEGEGREVRGGRGGEAPFILFTSQGGKLLPLTLCLSPARNIELFMNNNYYLKKLILSL